MKKWKEVLDIGSTIVMAFAAISIFGMFVNNQNKTNERKITTDWKEVVSQGVLLYGNPFKDDIVLVEFTDFECPICQGFSVQIDSVAMEYSNVAVVIQHYPLSNHSQAIPAAIAFECGVRQGKNLEMYKALFTNQANLGIIAWTDYAEVAGVADIGSFNECTKLPMDSFPRIAAGSLMAELNGVPGTPTVWVNNKWWGGYTSMPFLRESLDAVIEGREPPPRNTR